MSVAVAGRQLDEAQPIAMRVEPHRFGVDRNNRSETEPFGQITAIKSISHAGQRPAAPRGGAQEKTRTSTSFRPLEPESSASTNSATWASRDRRNKPRTPRCQSTTLPRLAFRRSDDFSTEARRPPRSHGNADQASARRGALFLALIVSRSYD